MDKSDHHDYHCYGCGIYIEINAIKPRGRTYFKDPTHCPYCGNLFEKRKEIVLTGRLMTMDEVTKSIAKSLREAKKTLKKKAEGTKNRK